MEIKKILVEKSGERLDKFLAEKLELSRSHVQGLVENEKVSVNGKAAKASLKVEEGMVISVEIPEPVLLNVLPEEIKLDILYEDEDVLVVNKPKGMVVHPANGNQSGTLVNAVLAHCGENLSGINGVIRPGIVHRIDKDTSGILVIAKNDQAHVSLAKQLKEHSMTRVYVAVVKGKLKSETGTISAPIGRNPKDRKKMGVVANGKHAVTHYKVIKELPDCSVIEVRLETGRTHQIRVHMAYIGHPLLGDGVYGTAKNKYGFEGQALHAKILGFKHPRTGEYMEFSSTLPEEFLELLAK
ncbi:MAG: RluA family pseudouridine synthase [Clostridia bacterium]|nr:RluA family pseudouridine synthase [Clostridia bacterium]